MWLPRLRDGFAARYGRPATVVARAPGRVNLLGEHTDYNEGFALPIAIERCTWFACAPRNDDRLRLASAQYPEPFDAPIDVDPTSAPAWTRYVLGVAALLRSRGARLGGFDAWIDGDLPLAAGLSSSAALEVAAALALSAAAGEALVTNELIDLCCEAERRYAGVPCGILDQTASLLARENHALLLDCRTRTAEQIPLALGDHALFVVDSGVPRRLADSEYGRRREECAVAVAHFQRLTRTVRALRDVPLETVRAQALQMPPLAAARALHVVSENRRTLAGADALRRGDMAAFGECMNESHRSLRDDYEVSCGPLDELVAALVQMPGVRGARMTGAGFGGSVVGLAHTAALASIDNAVQVKYRAPSAAPATMYRITAGAGASLELA